MNSRGLTGIGRDPVRPGRRRRDEGSATAELAVALPAVVLVLAACAGALQVASAQVRLQDAAALAARAAARGDDPAAAVAAAATAAGSVSGSVSSVRTWRDGALVCAAASAAVRWAPGLPPASLAAESCALAST